MCGTGRGKSFSALPVGFWDGVQQMTGANVADPARLFIALPY